MEWLLATDSAGTLQWQNGPGPPSCLVSLLPLAHLAAMLVSLHIILTRV